MPRTDKMELVYRAMFEPEAEQALSESDRRLVSRVKYGYTVWLEHPTYTDTQMRDLLMTQFKVEKYLAMQDMTLIRLLLGNVKNASKEFFRYKVNYILDQATNAAMAGDHAKAKSLTKIAEVFARNNRTEDNDGELLPWDKIVPKDWSLSVDPEVAGVKLQPGAVEAARRLRRQLLDEAQEVSYEDVGGKG